MDGTGASDTFTARRGLATFRTLVPCAVVNTRVPRSFALRLKQHNELIDWSGCEDLHREVMDYTSP
jgi:hypothetical protein